MITYLYIYIYELRCVCVATRVVHNASVCFCISHIHAAYAKFLWDAEEDEEEEEEENAASSRVLLQHGFMASATA